MKVSIVIPTLNEEKLIQATLSSIRSQDTNHEIELIVVDSYSKDRTVEIAKEFADKILFAPPGIIAVARNKGSMESKGEIIIGAGADSIYDKHWLAELIAPIEKGRAVATAGKLMPMQGNFVERVFAEYILNPIQFCTFSFGLPYAGGDNMAFSREAFMKVCGYRTDLVTGEDIDLLKRLRKVGRVSYCPKAVTHVSMRRVKKWGYAKYLYFHSTNFLKMQFSGKAYATYEPIR